MYNSQMIKLLKIIITLAIVSLLSGCADKVPFTEQEPLKNSALVYVYAPQVILSDDEGSAGKFKIMIDSKLIGIELEENQYTPLNLKPKKVKISLMLGALIVKDITLNLAAGDIYYLRVSLVGAGNFEFTKVKTKIGLKEIAKTTLYGHILEDKVDALVEQEDTPAKSSLSKTQQIKEAHQLKVDGIITQEEFEKLKAEILDER